MRQKQYLGDRNFLRNSSLAILSKKSAIVTRLFYGNISKTFRMDNDRVREIEACRHSEMRDRERKKVINNLCIDTMKT